DPGDPDGLIALQQVLRLIRRVLVITQPVGLAARRPDLDVVRVGQPLHPADVVDAYDVEVWAPRGEADRLREHQDAPYEPQHLLEGDETVGIGGIEFRTFSVPGHSPASIAYATDGIVFSGDVIFAGSIGRTDLEGGDMDTLVASIRRLMDALPGETIVASGHGPATTLERERQTNPFLGTLRA
ncbi:MAG TPA: MBL fold metallo-hydrolase, partial [Gaiellales bacterium]|nr:MBL fold metallo-hydrolase [Gaiellales bacterium]